WRSSASITLAWAASARPASVGVTPCGVRRNSSTLSSVSSCWMLLVTDDCERLRCLAAWRTVPASITMVRWRNWLSFIGVAANHGFVRIFQRLGVKRAWRHAGSDRLWLSQDPALRKAAITRGRARPPHQAPLKTLLTPHYATSRRTIIPSQYRLTGRATCNPP